MCENTKFLSCGDCKAVLFRLPGDFPGAPEGVQTLEAGVTDAAKEKHIPVAKVEGNKVTVVVGSVEHPQTEEHHISFILLETNMGIQSRTLAHDGKPEATFLLQDGEKAIAVYEMCNLHGLWKVDL